MSEQENLGGNPRGTPDSEGVSSIKVFGTLSIVHSPAFKLLLSQHLADKIASGPNPLGVEDVRKHLDEIINIETILRRLGDMVDLKLSALTIPLELNADSNKQSVAILFAIPPEFLINYATTGVLRYAVKDFENINFSWETFQGDPQISQKVLFHELVHFSTGLLPFNRLIREAVALAGGLVLEEQFPEYVIRKVTEDIERAPNLKIFQGAESFGLNLKDLPQNGDPILASLIQETSGRMLFDALGETPADRLKNFGIIVRKSCNLFNPTKEKNQFTFVPTSEGWLRTIDKLIPKFAHRIRTALAYQTPKSTTPVLAIVSPDDSKTSTGFLYSYQFKENPNFMVIQKAVLPGSQPGWHNYDMRYGATVKVPVDLRLSSEGRVFITAKQDGGKWSLTPAALKTMLGSSPDFHKIEHLATKSFTIEARQSGGTWHRLGDNFQIA